MLGVVQFGLPVDLVLVISVYLSLLLVVAESGSSGLLAISYVVFFSNVLRVPIADTWMGR